MPRAIVGRGRCWFASGSVIVTERRQTRGAERCVHGSTYRERETGEGRLPGSGRRETGDGRRGRCGNPRDASLCVNGLPRVLAVSPLPVSRLPLPGCLPSPASRPSPAIALG